MPESTKPTEIWQLWMSREDATTIIKNSPPGKVEVLSHSLGNDGTDLLFISVPKDYIWPQIRQADPASNAIPEIPGAAQQMDVLEGQMREMQASAKVINDAARRKLAETPIKGAEWVPGLDNPPTTDIPLPIIHADFTFVEPGRKIEAPRSTFTAERESAAPRTTNLGSTLTLDSGMRYKTLEPGHTGNKYLRTIFSRDRKTTMAVDVYCVASAFNVVHMGLQHALKKILCPGIRGGKSYKQDLIEARDALNRAIEDAI